MGLFGASAAMVGSTMTVEQGCATKADPPAAQPTILIGVSLGLTKGLSAFAKPLRDSIRAAEGEINAAGGVLGKRVNFDVQDDESDEEKGIVERIANDFVARGAVAVIGPIGSQQVVKTQAIYAKGNVIQISPSATSTDLTTIQSVGDRWLFRTTPADDFQGAAVLLFAQRTPRGLSDAGAPAPSDGGPPTSCTKLVIVNIDNAYGKSMAEVIQKSFPKRGGQVLLRKNISVTLAADYTALAAEVFALGPECMALIAYDDVAAPLVRDFKADKGYAALAAKGFFFIGTDGVYTDGFLSGGRSNGSDPKSANTSEGVYGTNPDTQPGTKEYNEFRTLFSSYFPLEPKQDAPAFAANTFDAAVLIALAVQRAGTITDRAAVRQALFEVATPPGRPYTPSQIGEALLAVKAGDDIDYKGASGSVDLEPNGNVKSGFIVWEAYRLPDDAGAKARTVDYRTVGRFTLEELLDQLK